MVSEPILARRWTRWAGGAVLLLALVYYLPLPGSLRDVAYAAVTVPLIIGAAAACLVRARRAPGGEGEAWLILAVGLLSWGVGEAGWAWIAVLAGQEVGFPHWTDGPYLLSTPLMVVGVLLLSWRRGTRHAIVQGLDAVLVAGAMFMAAWILFLKDAVDAAGQGDFAVGITLAYPVGDAILLAASILAFARLSDERRRQLWPLPAGIACMAVADAGYSLIILHEGTYPATWLDLGWPLAAFGIGWAALRPASSHPVRRGSASRFEEWAAMVALVPALLALGSHVLRGGSLDRVASAVGLATAIVLLARQAIFLNEHVALSRRLQQASRIAGLGTWRTDKAGRVLLDDGAVRLVGLAQDPAPSLAAMAAALSPQQPHGLESALAGLPPRTALERALVLPGADGPRHLQMHAERAADGTLHATLLDVTAQMRLVEERQRAQAHRDEAARLAELAKAKTRFINTAAHELNTPLTPIRLSLASLKRQAPGNQLALLERNVERLTRLLHDVLEGARLQADHLRLDRRGMDLAALVREVVDEHQPAAVGHGLSLSVDAVASLPVLADAGRLHEVLMNLLSNAIKFTPPEGHVHVRAVADEATARVEVTDTGRGIKEPDLALLFQPFTQVGDIQPAQGTGLGLYIARGIVEQHGGRLEARSAGEGRGATFSFTLPLVVQHVATV